MNAPQPVPPRRRLQELLAIPDRLRSEAEWDELHELEISLAPGNRADVAPPRAYTTSLPAADKPKSRPRARPGESGEARPKQQRASEPGTEAKKTFRKRHRKPAKPGGGAGGGASGGGGEPAASS